MDNIPLGYCQCGCGGKTRISHKNETKLHYIKGQPRRYLAGHNSKFSLRQKNSNWRGGRVKQSNGYVLIYQPDHPFAHKHGYILEHILVMEKALGRPIKKTEAIHHIDGNRSKNHVGNLILFATVGMHNQYHTRLRAFKVSGHWDWRKCAFCHNYDAPNKLYFPPAGMPRHKECSNAYSRLHRQAKLDAEGMMKGKGKDA